MDSLAMRKAASTTRTPSSTAEKYSALLWPKGWVSSGGRWAKRLDQEGVEIPFPHRTLYFGEPLRVVKEAP